MKKITAFVTSLLLCGAILSSCSIGYTDTIEDSIVGKWITESIKDFDEPALRYGSDVEVYIYDDSTACMSYRDYEVTDIMYIETRVFYTCLQNGSKLRFEPIKTIDYYLTDLGEIGERNNKENADYFKVKAVEVLGDGRMSFALKVNNSFGKTTTYLLEKANNDISDSPKLGTFEEVTAQYEKMQSDIAETLVFCETFIQNSPLPLKVLDYENQITYAYDFFFLLPGVTMAYEDTPFAIVDISEKDNIHDGDMAFISHDEWGLMLEARVLVHPDGKYALYYVDNYDEIRLLPQEIIDAFINNVLGGSKE